MDSEYDRRARDEKRTIGCHRRSTQSEVSGVRTRNGNLSTLSSLCPLVGGSSKARHEKHRTSTIKQLLSGSSFLIKRAVIEFWRVSFWSDYSQKALTYSVVRFVRSPLLVSDNFSKPLE